MKSKFMRRRGSVRDKFHGTAAVWYVRYNRLHSEVRMFRKQHIAVFLLALSLPAYSQITTASLEGVVRDPTGAVIAGARVQVTNTATNLPATLATDSGGRLPAPASP